MTRVRVALYGLSAAGAVVLAGQWLLFMRLGSWPMHDAAAYWRAGRWLLEGRPIYEADGIFLAFLYGPPWAVLFAPFALLPPDVLCAALVVAEIAALRYIARSWLVAGLLCWLPFTYWELAVGNVNLLMAAAIYAAATGVRGSGFGVALFALAKLSPAALLLVMPRRTAILAGVGLVALTLPWLHLWPEWFAMLARAPVTQAAEQHVPLLPRLALALPLLALRRPWSVALGVALAVPAFHLQSAVLFIPGLVLLGGRVHERVAQMDRVDLDWGDPRGAVRRGAILGRRVLAAQQRQQDDRRVGLRVIQAAIPFRGRERQEGIAAELPEVT